jgi:hypothetical protein
VSCEQEDYHSFHLDGKVDVKINMPYLTLPSNVSPNTHFESAVFLTRDKIENQISVKPPTASELKALAKAKAAAKATAKAKNPLGNRRPSQISPDSAWAKYLYK